MCQIFTSNAPWGILTEKDIFHLVVQQESRPDRPDEDFGLTDHIWSIMEKCWQQNSRQRPTFDNLVQLLQSTIRTSAKFHGRSASVSRVEGSSIFVRVLLVLIRIQTIMGQRFLRVRARTP
jgi:hypothetical protein